MFKIPFIFLCLIQFVLRIVWKIINKVKKMNIKNMLLSINLQSIKSIEIYINLSIMIIDLNTILTLKIQKNQFRLFFSKISFSVVCFIFYCNRCQFRNWLNGPTNTLKNEVNFIVEFNYNWESWNGNKLMWNFIRHFKRGFDLTVFDSISCQ